MDGSFRGLGGVPKKRDAKNLKLLLWWWCFSKGYTIPKEHHHSRCVCGEMCASGKGWAPEEGYNKADDGDDGGARPRDLREAGAGKVPHNVTHTLPPK